MEFTVLIPAYNEAGNIRKCLDALLSNGYPADRYEVIVVDDGSTDDTRRIVGEYAKKHANIRCVSKENAGKGSALNAGLRLASGDYVLVTDADTIVGTTWFEMMGESLRSADMVQGSSFPTETKNIWQKVQYAKDLLRQKYLGRSVDIAIGANNGFKRSVGLEVGGFSESTRSVTADFIHKLKMGGHVVSHRPDIISRTPYPDTFATFIRQRLRWMEYNPNETFLKLLYNPGFSAVVLVSLLACIFTLRWYYLLIIPLGILLDVVVHLSALMRVLRSAERWLIPYFLLYCAVLNIVIRPILTPYILYRLFFCHSKPIFEKFR